MKLDKHKVWNCLGVALWAATSLNTAAMAADETASPGNGFPAPVCRPGEGGQGGKRGETADLSIDDTAYLTQLGLMRGHLNVGVELYLADRLEAAATHMKHPEEELYASLKGSLVRRGVAGFEKQLQTLAGAVEENAGREKVDAAYREVLAAITRAENAVADPSPYIMGQVVHQLVLHAATEYRQAIKAGKVVEPHEYQDGMGFTHVAESWLDKLEASNANQTVVHSIREQMGRIEPAYPSVIPPDKVTVEPSVLDRAAARMEIAVLDLRE